MKPPSATISANSGPAPSRVTARRLSHILLVEDSPTDIMIVREVLERSGPRNTVHVVEDGAEALRFLRREASYRSAPRPDLVLLDLNLPGINGQEVLAAIKHDPRLVTIPVVVLTSSQNEADVAGAYRQLANCYVTKPVDYQDFTDTVQRIERFWLEVATLTERD